MGSVELEEISHYLLAKFSALLNEAEKDHNKLSCISRFRDAEKLIKKCTSPASRSPSYVDIRESLYKLISALSECRVFAQQRRGVAPRNGFLQFKDFWFTRQINGQLDNLEGELREALGAVKQQPPYGIDDDDGDEFSSDGFVGLDTAAGRVKEFIVEGDGSDGSCLKGIGIVGVGGSGKTALARKVFDDLDVRNTFSPRIWVSLSGTLYDEPVSVNLRVKILRKMLEQAGCDVSELVTTYVGIPELTEKLYHRLMGKRYLIVLDEVWHVNDWYVDLGSELPKGDAFGDCISHALPKDSAGRIIVTSRRGGVARDMIGGENLIPIDTLLDQEICWPVFCHTVRKVSEAGLDDITLSNMEEEITKKCVGLPLAARTLAEIIPKQIHHRQQN